jgi:NAD(P)H-hydrate repair Nnr-like enzyme with NAD(P)H-hydrate dehydratase domain
MRNAAVHACVFASILTKQAAELAFAQKGRSMTAPDVVEQIGAAFRRLHPEG